MASSLNPYISFAGTARAAMEFYQGVFGGELATNTFKRVRRQAGPTRRQDHARQARDRQTA